MVELDGDKSKWEINNDDTYGYNHQRILRYSKTYDNIELYDFDTNIKSSHKNNSNRIMVFSKRRKLLSINTKNYVLFNGNRYLSLKNWCGFHLRESYKEPFVKLLMKAMLGGKEWVMDLSPKDFYLITNKNSRKANSLEEAIELECGARPAKMLLKKFETHSVIGLYNLIDPNKIHDITNFLKRNRDSVTKLMEGNYEEEHRLLLYYYFLTKDNRCEKHIVIDYLKMLQEEGKKVNLNISSYKTLKRNHDTLSAKILQRNMKKTKKRRLKVSKMYPEIKSLPDMKVEKIKSIKRLDEESAILHHCVHGYDSRINKGECCIYSLVHNNQRYTLQINASKVLEDTDTHTNVPKKTEYGEFVYEFKMVQLKGKYNCDAPETIKKSLDLMCDNHNIIPIEKSRIRLRPNVYEEKEHKQDLEQRQVVQRVIKEKKDVVQVGEKILEHLIERTASQGVPALEELSF